MEKQKMITDIERRLAVQKENEDELFTKAAKRIAARDKERCSLDDLRSCLQSLVREADEIIAKQEQLRLTLHMVQALD